jgi:hypothetical protein
MGKGERGGEQPRFGMGEFQIRPEDRADATARRTGIAVGTAHPGRVNCHAGGELAQGLRAHRGQQLITIGEVPISGVGHHPDHPGGFPQHYRARAAGAGQLDARGEQTVANCTSWAPPTGLGHTIRRCVHHHHKVVDSVHLMQ